MDGSATFTMVVSSTIISTPRQSTISAHQRLRVSGFLFVIDRLHCCPCPHDERSLPESTCESGSATLSYTVPRRAGVDFEALDHQRSAPMPDPKDNAKMTGDTHLPDVESDMPFQESSTDAVGLDGT